MTEAVVWIFGHDRCQRRVQLTICRDRDDPWDVERLRGALRDQADAFVPQVEEALDRVRSRGRLERWQGAAVAVAASAAAIAGAVVARISCSFRGTLRQARA